MFTVINKISPTRQECIPVGCIPPASVAVSGEGVYRGACVSAQGCVCLGRFQPRGVPAQGVSAWGVSATPRGHTDACENITLPQTSFAGGKYGILISE